MAFLLSLAACGSAEDLVTAEEVQPTLDALDTELVRVTEAPIPGELHGLADTMDIHVSGDIVDTYNGLAAGSSFPERSVLVKEQYNEDGSFNSFTVMVKGPPGQADEVGDWWFGFAGADGQVSDGPQACIDCHLGAPDTDYVFGL